MPRRGAVLAFAVLAIVFGPAPAGAAAPVLRLAASEDIPPLDPQADGSYNTWSFSLLRASCTTLMALPDRPRRAAEPVAPDGAMGMPVVSRDGRTYTFTVRGDLRFSDGSHVTAASYARAIQRLRDPSMHQAPPGGAPIANVYTGDFAAVHARGRTLRIRLRAPAGDLLTRLAMPFFCPVPTDFPSDPDGIALTVGSGPYRLVSQVANRSLVFERNRFYRGPRAQRFSQMTVTIGGTPTSLFHDVEQGTVDYAFDGVPRELVVSAAVRYGFGKGRLFYKAANNIAYVAFNLRSPLFRDNLPLRRAVGYAIDRPALFRTSGVGLSIRRVAQLIPPAIPGFDPAANVYPLSGADFRTARRLARGHLRGGHVVLYSFPNPTNLAQSQVIAYDLKQIGLDVEIKPFSFQVLFEKLADPNEPWDMTGVIGWIADYPDPADFVIPLLTDLSGTPANISKANVSNFADAGVDRRVRAANRLVGEARIHAFAAIARDVVRDDAPIVPVGAGQAMGLVSPRLGCVTFDPETEINITGLCLRG